MSLVILEGITLQVGQSGIKKLEYKDLLRLSGSSNSDQVSSISEECLALNYPPSLTTRISLKHNHAAESKII